MRARARHILPVVPVVVLAGLLAGLLVVALAGLPAGSARAQQAPALATLVADQVLVEGAGLEARGNVVVFYKGARLSAAALRYDSIAGRLQIEGPIVLRDGSGTLFLADAAELSPDLREGILESARLVLNQQLQIAAAEINRVSGRYTQMTKVIASSCQVCLGRPVPLWSIRASRVIHDQQARQLYFHDAQLRLLDIPVFYLPRLRLPDPTVTRASGFLVPQMRLNSKLGSGLRAPYFITLGRSADLTIAPFVTDVTRTLELRYRQAFANGRIDFDAAWSRDDLRPGVDRSYLFGQGSFDLPADFRLRFHLQQASDPAYLADYGYSGQDRLLSDITVSRVRRDQYIFADLVHWETLRASELPIADQLPFAQADLLYEQRFTPPGIGGQAAVQVSAQGHARQSTADGVGRDQARVGLGLEWGRDWVLSNGMVVTLEGRLAADFYRVEQDSAFAPELTRTSRAVGVGLSWPMARTTRTGAREVLEPVAELAWSATSGPAVPNDDSVMVEFDAANLFDLSRFPGQDAVETGLRANVGLRWSRFDPEGLSFSLTGGRVFRATDEGQFTAASGLDGLASDWLIAGQARLGSGLWAQARALVADDFSLTRAETRLGWRSERIEMNAGQVWVIADAAEDRADPISTLTLDGTWRFNDNWSSSLDTAMDLQAGTPTRARLGLTYENECIRVGLALSRRFASSGSAAPSTDIGVSVELNGFGASGGRRAGGCASPVP